MSFVENSFCWEKELLQAMHLKMDIFVTSKSDSEQCENNINQNQSICRTKPRKVFKKRCAIVINSYVFLH
jgi:hypothetical protein